MKYNERYEHYVVNKKSTLNFLSGTLNFLGS